MIGPEKIGRRKFHKSKISSLDDRPARAEEVVE
jgi:hypothetical protein